MNNTNKKYLSAADILKQQVQKQTRRYEAFEHIVSSCYKKIEKCVQVTRNIYSCFYEVPEFLIGFPLYDLNECIQYVANILTTKGFTVQYMFPRVLLVSWMPKNSMTLPMPPGNAKRGKKPFVQMANTSVKPSGKIVLDLS
jgi:hypothetical protein